MNDFTMIDDFSFDASGKDALFYIHKDKYAPQLFNKIKEIELSRFQDMRKKNIAKHIQTTAKNMMLSRNTTRTNTPSPLLPPEWQSAQPSRTSSRLSIINPMTIQSSSNHTSSDNLPSYNQSPIDIDEEDGDDNNIPKKKGIGGREKKVKKNKKE
jgi:hypothetical protein